MNWLPWLLIYLIGLFLILWWWRKDTRRRNAEYPEDGVSGGPRGRVWTEEERELYRHVAGDQWTEEERRTMAERRQRARARLSVVGQCPPHLPAYDPDTDETYCEHCLERLPNEGEKTHG